jgi:hypothetical protein
MAAMMAQQPVREAMLDQPSGAVRTAEAVAARPTQGQRRIAATVQKQQRLLAGCERRRDLGDQRRRQKTSGFQPLAAHVDEPGFGQPRRGVAARQRHPLVTAACDIDHGFERGRRRYQHDRDVRQRGAQYRHVARLVADPLFLLVGRIVLLIDDDQSEIGERQEQGRTGADHDRRPPGGDRPPGVAALGLADLGMPLRRQGAEAFAKAFEPLRAESDLRQ